MEIITEPHPKKLLVVDDEPLVRQTLSLVLKDEYEVTTVASGEEAVEASTREPYPVVILDLCMEGISGIETLRRLKKIREGQNIIILTAYESMETAIEALNLGAFNYLTKPFERRHLRHVVSRGFEVYEQRLARREEMQRRLMGVHDTFFSLLCHEFNTPLNVILGFSDLLLHSPRDREAQTWVKHIRDAGTHLHDILMEIVDYTAASHLAVAGVEETFLPSTLVTPLIDSLAERSVFLEVTENFPQGLQVSGPSEAILMILRKLSNMASQRSERITLRMALEDRDGPNLRLTLGSTGIFAHTLNGSAIDQLFEPYQFAPKDDSACAMSLGLELATCRKIADYAHATVEGGFDGNGELQFVVEVPVHLAN